MLYQLSNEGRRETSVEDDRIPMLLVHVVTRSDRLPLVPQLHRSLGIAFEVHTPHLILQASQRKHLVRHFINQSFRTEGSGLLRHWQGQTQLNRLLQFHQI